MYGLNICRFILLHRQKFYLRLWELRLLCALCYSVMKICELRTYEFMMILIVTVHVLNGFSHIICIEHY